MTIHYHEFLTITVLEENSDYKKSLQFTVLKENSKQQQYHCDTTVTSALVLRQSWRKLNVRDLGPWAKKKTRTFIENLKITAL